VKVGVAVGVLVGGGGVVLVATAVAVGVGSTKVLFVWPSLGVLSVISCPNIGKPIKATRPTSITPSTAMIGSRERSDEKNFAADGIIAS
jgi:hypothetical protein